MTNYQDFASRIRKHALRMHFLSKESHVGSALSCADIIAVLYGGVLSVSPDKPLDENRDRFILSKGHAVAALYAALAEKGFFNLELLDTFCQDGSQLPGHSTMQSVPGVEVSTGGLGHGLPMGVGMALAAKQDGKPWKTFVLMSDGECNEGTTWESAWFAAHHQLDNLIAIIDKNGQQGLGKSAGILSPEPFAAKWAAFGWEVIEINGHDAAAIEQALKAAPTSKPRVVICTTTKGKGVSFMEDQLAWHYKNPNEQEYQAALKELS